MQNNKTGFNKEQLKKRIIQKQIREKINENEDKKIIIFHIFWILSLVFIVFIAAIYLVYLKDLPSINKLREDVLPENTIIYDKNWQEIYKLYKDEKRTYVEYGKIAQNMKNAIVSTEDKTFFTNRWFDFKWLVRAGLNYITGKSERIQWTSTISQQLIKVSFLTNERSLKRKLQELYLSFRLNANYSKEKILELYLNKIPFWSNAYWIEEASKTFFGKSAKELWILESSILASIPKWPTYYSPYNHADRLMWYIYAYNIDSPKDIIKIAQTENPAFYNPLTKKLKSIISDLEIKKIWTDNLEICWLDSQFFKKEIKIKNSCTTLDYSKLLDLLNSIRISYKDLPTEEINNDLLPYTLEYNTWRKDFVLGRMLEDGKINIEDYKKAVVDSIDFKFKKYRENIKYPYFVFYVKEYLEDKYGENFWAQWWLRIYTTIDPKLQDKAEELIKKQVEINKSKHGASNAALISVDNRNGNIIAMVGWVDYFDWSKWANVNIITSERQPWSSFKPIVYLNAIENKPISPDTPIYDSETEFWDWEPDNYDRKFMWLMPLRKALDYSRNIPAVKLFFYWWWENEVIKFANKLWILSLKLWMWYGWPLAIGTWELKPLELVQAYSVFANYWRKKDLMPILKIEDKKWNIIFQSRDNKWIQVASEVSAYILSKILSDATSRPNAYWNNVLTLKDRPVAAKTGTSNKDVSKWNKKEILPWDLWTAGYTPQITTVVWAGNTDGSATKWSCDGLNCAAPIWHDFMEFAHIGLEKKNFSEPDWVIKATISKMSWKLATSSTPAEFKITSIFAVKPTLYDGWYKSIEVDSLCNWRVTDATPKDAIVKIYEWWSLAPLIDSYDKTWLKSISKYSNFTDNTSWSGALNYDEYDENRVCERPTSDTAGMSIATNLVDGQSLPEWKNKLEIRFDSNNPIVSIIFSINWEIIKTYPIKQELGWNIDDTFELADIQKTKISIKMLDKFWFSKTISYTINWTPQGDNIDNWSWETSTNSIQQSITISMVNPVQWDNDLGVYFDQNANIRWKISSTNSVDVINVYLNWNLYKILDWWDSFVVPVNENHDMQVGKYSYKIEAIDANWNKTSKIIDVDVLSR